MATTPEQPAPGQPDGRKGGRWGCIIGIIILIILLWLFFGETLTFGQ